MRVLDLLRRQSSVKLAFDIGILFKGLDGVLEIVGGPLVFFVTPQTIRRVIIVLTQHELSEDPRDVIASHLVRLASHFSASSQAFVSPNPKITQAAKR